jgi:hypothetical protein
LDALRDYIGDCEIKEDIDRARSALISLLADPEPVVQEIASLVEPHVASDEAKNTSHNIEKRDSYVASRNICHLLARTVRAISPQTRLSLALLVNKAVTREISRAREGVPMNEGLLYAALGALVALGPYPTLPDLDADADCVDDVASQDNAGTSNLAKNILSNVLVLLSAVDGARLIHQALHSGLVLFPRTPRFHYRLRDILSESPHLTRRVVLKYLNDHADRIEAHSDLIASLSDILQRIIKDADINDPDDDARLALLYAIRLASSIHVLTANDVVKLFDAVEDEWGRFALSQVYVEGHLDADLPASERILHEFIRPAMTDFRDEYIAPRPYIAAVLAIASSGTLPDSTVDTMMRKVAESRRPDIIAALRDCLQRGEHRVFRVRRTFDGEQRVEYAVRAVRSE